MIKTVGQHTGKNFILDPRVQGTVNIVSDRPVRPDMLYQMLLSALRVQGFAAVARRLREDRARGRAQQAARPARRRRGASGRARDAGLPVKNESAVELVPVLRPLVTANNLSPPTEQQRDRHHRPRENVQRIQRSSSDRSPARAAGADAAASRTPPRSRGR